MPSRAPSPALLQAVADPSVKNPSDIRRGRSGLELDCQPGDHFTLMAGNIQFAGAWLTGAVPSRDSGCAIRRTPADLRNVEQGRVGIANGHDDHAMVGQRRPVVWDV